MIFPAYISNYIIPAYIQTYDYSKDVRYCEGIEYFENEVFVPITNEMVNGIMPYYFISNYGRVYSSYYNRILRVCFDKDGYCTIMMTINGKKRLRKVHRLVLMAFCPIENPENYQVNHKDGCRYNNCLYNLEWATPMQNSRHSIRYLRNNNDKGIVYLIYEQAYQIGELIKENQLTAKQIANMYNCSEYQIYAIHQGISFHEVYEYYKLYEVNMGHKCRKYEDKVPDIIRMLKEKIPISTIARQLNVSRSTIYSIINGESYNEYYDSL